MYPKANSTGSHSYAGSTEVGLIGKENWLVLTIDQGWEDDGSEILIRV